MPRLAVETCSKKLLKHSSGVYINTSDNLELCIYVISRTLVTFMHFGLQQSLTPFCDFCFMAELLFLNASICQKFQLDVQPWTCSMDQQGWNFTNCLIAKVASSHSTSLEVNEFFRTPHSIQKLFVNGDSICIYTRRLCSCTIKQQFKGTISDFRSEFSEVQNSYKHISFHQCLHT